MDVFEAIKLRREITNYQNRQVPAEVLNKIIDSAYMAPTGNNLPSREFVLVTNEKRLLCLSESTPFVSWLAEAKAAIVITGRPNISKYWLQDASIASAFIWLSAVESGVGAAFGAIYHAEDAVKSKKREAIVRTTLSIPEDRRIITIMGLGYPASEPKHKQLQPKEQIIHYETF